jgi:hypothetical protein
MRKLILASSTVLLLWISVFGQQHASDRAFERLKGRVQKVVTETAELTNESGKWTEGKRMPTSAVTYDEAGNTLRLETFYQGQPYSIFEYAFLEGDRVVKITDLQPGNSGGVGPGPRAPRDPRYTLKYVYKYDHKGNRTAELSYGNDTSLGVRQVYSYDDRGNRIESTTYIPNSKSFSRRTRASFDDKGNVLQENENVLSDIVERSYTYEFDSTGNWVKRQKIVRATRDGKPVFERHSMDYRSITYF